MKLIPIISKFDIFLAFHLFIHLYGHYLLIFVCNWFQMVCSINPKSYFLIGVFIVLLKQKTKFEGANFPLLVSIFVEICVIFSSFQIFPTFFYILANFFYVCFLISLIIFQTYDVPFENNLYKVGYRKMELNNLNDVSKNVAIFYPTEETTQDVAWLPDENILLNLFRNHWLFNIFKGFVLFSLSFLHHITLGVNLNSKIADLSKTEFLNKEKYPVIIFSHGFIGNRHCYSIFCKYLAGQGAIVFCTEHNDKEFNGLNQKLQQRYEVVQSLLDFIYNPKNIEEVFQEPINLDYNKISVAGHSFGGGTAIFSGILEKRITGGVLTLDPYVMPIDDQMLNVEWEKPTLCISTERFNNLFYLNHKKLENLMKINYNKNKNLFCYLQNSSYLQQGDIVYLFPRLFKLFNLIDRRGNVGEQFEFNLKLLEFFFLNIICQNKNIDIVKEKFWTHVKDNMLLDRQKIIKII